MSGLLTSATPGVRGHNLARSPIHRSRSLLYGVVKVPGLNQVSGDDTPALDTGRGHPMRPTTPPTMTSVTVVTGLVSAVARVLAIAWHLTSLVCHVSSAGPDLSRGKLSFSLRSYRTLTSSPV